jgi:hypothetical protein
MAENYKGQSIIRLNGDRIGDTWVEAVVVMPGVGGQPLGFMGKALTKDAALAEAKRLAREAIDKQLTRK